MTAEKKVMISYNRRDVKSVSIAEEICAELSSAGVVPYSLNYDDGKSGGLRGADSAESGEGSACMITVGGDGSIISHGKLAAQWGIPLLGVNTGRLGFMANLEPAEIKRIPDILRSEFKVSRRMIMEASITYANGDSMKRGVPGQQVKAAGILRLLRRYRGVKAPGGRCDFQHPDRFYGVFALSRRAYNRPGAPLH